jgi:hypothetical protein
MLKRLPYFPDIVSVYSVIAFMLFAWSLLIFFWYLPSWLYFMSFGDLFAVFCYVMASSFFESLAFLLFLLLLSFFLPPKYLRDEFVARGTSITLCVIGLIMLNFRLNISNKFDISLPWFGVALFFAAVAGSIFFTRLRPVRQALIWLSDRLIVFLYILIPLSLLSLLVVLVRNSI